MTHLHPAEKLASIAQVLGAARRNESACVAQVFVVFVKYVIERIRAAIANCPSQHSLITKMFQQVMHYHRSVPEGSVGGEFLVDESLYQALIDLFSGLDTDRSRKIVELACQAENTLSAPARETKPVQPAGELVHVLDKRFPTQMLQVPWGFVEVFQHAHSSLLFSNRMPYSRRNEPDFYVA